MNEGPQIPDDTLMDAVRASITLPRLRIIDETETAYRVQFGETEYEISKGTESQFVMNVSSSVSCAVRLVMEPRQGGNYIEQDEDVPQEFKEVMMVHEIREVEYKTAGLDGAHDRAVHDEALYVLKHLPREIQALYFEFARKYRHTAAEQAERERRREEAAQADARRRVELECRINATIRDVEEQRQKQLLDNGFLITERTGPPTYGKKKSANEVGILLFMPHVSVQRNETQELYLHVGEHNRLKVNLSGVLDREFLEAAAAECADCMPQGWSTAREEWQMNFSGGDFERMLELFEKLHAEAIRRKRKRKK